MTTATTQERSSQLENGVGSTNPFDQINSHGCYIWRSTGDLLRVPEDALAPERSPKIDLVSKDPCLVTKISSDPYVSVSKARAIAADMDLPVNF